MTNGYIATSVFVLEITFIKTGLKMAMFVTT